MDQTLNLGEVSDLERRKQVRLRLRPDLQIAPQKYEGKTFYVVKDPVCLRYYRFKEQEYFLLQLFDGKHTLEEAQKEFENEFRPDRLTLEDLEALRPAAPDRRAGAERVAAGRQAALRAPQASGGRSELMQTFTNILYIKIPVFDPDRS